MKESIIWCNKEELVIISDRKPITGIRKPLPSDTLDIKKDMAIADLSVYEFVDELVYIILPSKSNNSSLNPGEELTIVY